MREFRRGKSLHSSSRESNGIVPHLRLKGSDSVSLRRGTGGGRDGCDITNVIDNESATSDDRCCHTRKRDDVAARGMRGGNRGLLKLRSPSPPLMALLPTDEGPIFKLVSLGKLLIFPERAVTLSRVRGRYFLQSLNRSANLVCVTRIEIKWDLYRLKLITSRIKIKRTVYRLIGCI